MSRTILFILSFFALTLLCTEAREIRIIKVGKPGQITFNDVSERHIPSGWFWDGTSKLVCSGQGAAFGKWSYSPEQNDDMITEKGSAISFQDLVESAEKKISAGETRGSFISDLTIDGECWHRKVEWVVEEDSDNIKTEITCTIEQHD